MGNVKLYRRVAKNKHKNNINRCPITTYEYVDKNQQLQKINMSNRARFVATELEKPPPAIAGGVVWSLYNFFQFLASCTFSPVFIKNKQSIVLINNPSFQSALLFVGMLFIQGIQYNV